MAEVTDEKEREEKLNAIEDRWTTMLFNISQKRSIHEETAGYLEKYLDCRKADEHAVEEFAKECKTIWKRETGRFTLEKFDALFNGSAARRQTYGDVGVVPSWEEIEEHFRHFLHAKNRHVIVINSTDKKTKENQAFYTQSSDRKSVV